MLDYKQFNDITGFEIDGKVFDNYLRESLDLINYFTFNRLTEEYQATTDKCLIDLISLKHNNKTKLDGLNKAVKSETVDAYSVTYADTSDLIKNSLNAEFVDSREIIRHHFLHTGLLYRGV